jgi:hypothetical protein
MSADPPNDLARDLFSDDPVYQAAWDQARARGAFKPEEATIGIIGFVARRIDDLDRRIEDRAAAGEQRLRATYHLPALAFWLNSVPRFEEFRTYLQVKLLEESLVDGIEKARKMLVARLKCRFVKVDRMTLTEAMDALKGHPPGPAKKPIPPVICSQAAVARFLGRDGDQHTPKLMEKLKAENVVREYVEPEKKGRKFQVRFVDQALHEKALAEISGKPSRRRPKRRTS